jgi:hypothetical protein
MVMKTKFLPLITKIESDLLPLSECEFSARNTNLEVNETSYQNTAKFLPIQDEYDEDGLS